LQIGGTQVAQKTQTLEELCQLFSSDSGALTDTVVAAYGNRDTDVRAYVDAGIPTDR
jgi:phosphatidate phosphatase PAH1